MDRDDHSKKLIYGYTLAEMAICLCIIGILMSGALTGAGRYFEGEKRAETKRQLDVVMNILGAYVQTHDRLPCPADPKAAPAQAGVERDGGKCHRSDEGILPWKELAIPQSLTLDAWGNAITYKPAPSLTADMQTASADDVPDAYRGDAWFDADGNHLDRAKARFCGSAPPAIKTEEDMVAAAQALSAIEPAAGGASPAAPAKGSVSIPHYMEGPAVPLAAEQAVTLTSHGDTGHDIILSLRSDQLYARGGGSCAAPPAAPLPGYSCMTQSFSKDAGLTVKDPDTGAIVALPALYGVHLALTAKKFQLRVSVRKASGDDRADSLGFYIVRENGQIGGVRLLVPDTRAWAKGTTAHFTVPAEPKMLGIGLFVVPDGYNQMNGYRSLDLSQMRFVSGSGTGNRTASVADQNPPVLVAMSSTGFESKITGAGGVSAWHLYSNLNPRRANRTLRDDSICHFAGEKVGPHGDYTCKGPSPLTGGGIDPAHPVFAQIGFEEDPAVNCYELKNGGCGYSDNASVLLPDGEGGYIASVGDNSYDDLAFSIGLAACPQGL